MSGDCSPPSPLLRCFVGSHPYKHGVTDKMPNAGEPAFTGSALSGGALQSLLRQQNLEHPEQEHDTRCGDERGDFKSTTSNHFLRWCRSTPLVHIAVEPPCICIKGTLPPIHVRDTAESAHTSLSNLFENVALSDESNRIGPIASYIPSHPAVKSNWCTLRESNPRPLGS